MKDKTVAALLALNFLITGGLCALLLTKFQNMPLLGSDSSELKLHISEVEKPLEKVSSDLDKLTSTIQRFNTSLVQYDFLKREMDRLAELDKNIGARAQVAASQKTDTNTKEIEKVLAKLGTLSGQVKEEQQARRKTMLKLISNLEKQLTQIPATRPSPRSLPQSATQTSQNTVPRIGSAAPSQAVPVSGAERE